MARAITPSHCRHQFEILAKAVAEWENSNDPKLFIDWRYDRVKGFSQALEVAFENFFDMTADAGCTVVNEAKAMIVRIDVLFAEYGRFKQGIAEESPSCSPSGSDGLWQAFNRVAEVFKDHVQLPKPTSIKRLVEMEVSMQQIAAIYGWTFPDGSPDIQKVTEEIDEPGKHYDPKTWVHPARLKRQAFIDKDWENREHPPRAQVFNVTATQPNPNWVPPSLEVMVQVGASAEQIAEVHKISIEKAAQLLAEANNEESELAKV